jgi:hypothetical protein
MPAMGEGEMRLDDLARGHAVALLDPPRKGLNPDNVR